MQYYMDLHVITWNSSLCAHAQPRGRPGPVAEERRMPDPGPGPITRSVWHRARLRRQARSRRAGWARHATVDAKVDASVLACRAQLAQPLRRDESLRHRVSVCARRSKLQMSVCRPHKSPESPRPWRVCSWAAARE